MGKRNRKEKRLLRVHARGLTVTPLHRKESFWKRMQRLTFPFPFVHHQSHVYQQPRPSGTTINRGNEDWMLLMNEIDPIFPFPFHADEQSIYRSRRVDW